MRDIKKVSDEEWAGRFSKASIYTRDRVLEVLKFFKGDRIMTHSFLLSCQEAGVTHPVDVIDQIMEVVREHVVNDFPKFLASQLATSISKFV